MPRKKKPAESTALVPKAPQDAFKIQAILPDLPRQLRTELEKNRVSQAQSIAKEALKTLKREKADTIDRIAAGLKELRTLYASACKPWENLLDEIRALRAAEEARLTALAARRNEKKAIKAEAAGATELAEDLREAATHEVHSDTTFRRVWRARVTDPSAVPILYHLWTLRPIDEALLNRLAKDEAARALTIPGVEWYEEKIPVLK